MCPLQIEGVQLLIIIQKRQKCSITTVTAGRKKLSDNYCSSEKEFKNNVKQQPQKLRIFKSLVQITFCILKNSAKKYSGQLMLNFNKS